MSNDKSASNANMQIAIDEPKKNQFAVTAFRVSLIPGILFIGLAIIVKVYLIFSERDIDHNSLVIWEMFWTGLPLSLYMLFGISNIIFGIIALYHKGKGRKYAVWAIVIPFIVYGIMVSITLFYSRFSVF